MWTKQEEYQFNGDKAVWYDATVDGVEVTVWKQEKDWGKGKWAFGLTYGPVKMANRARTVAAAKEAAIALVRGYF